LQAEAEIVLRCNSFIHELEIEAMMMGALNYGDNGLLGIEEIWLYQQSC
jgi:hypothetical protein